MSQIDAKDYIHLVKNKDGEFYDVIPKVNKSLQTMREKVLGVKEVKWGWHVVLTFNNFNLNNTIKNKQMNGYVLRGILTKIYNNINKNRKFFWKYEEGGKFGRSHFHLLIDFKRKISSTYLMSKLYPKGWQTEAADIKGIIKKQRSYSMNRYKSNLEILMGYLLMYYINKDVIKKTGYNRFSGGGKWRFGKKYQFELNKPFYEYERFKSVGECKSKLITTQENFKKYYDSVKNMDGHRLFMRKLRKLKNGQYSEILY